MDLKISLINLFAEFYILSKGHVDCLATLIDFGAQSDLAQPGTLLTPLHRAAAHGHAMCLQQLLHT